MSFNYAVEKVNSIPATVVSRATGWRSLRESLGDMRVGSKYCVSIVDAEEFPFPERLVESMRAAVYNHVKALRTNGVLPKDARTATYLERDEETKEPVKLWIEIAQEIP